MRKAEGNMAANAFWSWPLRTNIDTGQMKAKVEVVVPQKLIAFLGKKA